MNSFLKMLAGLIQIIIQAVQMRRQNKERIEAEKDRQKLEKEHEKIDNDPSDWFSDHFGGVSVSTDDSAAPGRDQAGPSDSAP